ncbi:hypothetical protein [Streptomyces sp. CC228A]|uniref:hypothetical protein n=1 Tax=Streptomyces sp. CC228A TaxID=2898186 RepID=UPI0027E510DE|nr:hypothetical protein [Streptomyces sp. CC228A]
MAVIDDGRYRATPTAGPPPRPGHPRGRATPAAGRPDLGPMFTRLDGPEAIRPDGTAEHVDAIALATEYRPDLTHLAPLGALDDGGRPLHRDGASTVRPGLAYVGLAWQRSLSPASLRGVGRDARRVARRPARRLERA